MQQRSGLACVLLIGAGAWAQPNLDDVAQRALKEFDVPGMAIGVVLDGKVVVAKGYGVRKLTDPEPVSEKTLFGIASNTKAFTAAALAMLVDEKKISWDDRVIDILPWFQMSDPYVSREMRVRDLLVHRSGLALGAGDLMLFPDGTLTAHDILQRLRHVPLATSFRSKYAYDNVLYIVAGAVIEQASGKKWDEFIRERIFQPLGMAHSRTSVNQVPSGADIASPHARDEGKLRVVGYTKLDPAAPAGAIQSPVEDLLKWVSLQLNEGQYPGGRLFSAEQSKEMWTPHIFVPISSPPPELASIKPNFQAYALGWFISEYRGHRLVYHTGGLSGMVTRVTLVPDRKLGVIVFTNQEEGAAFQAVTMTLLDHYLGGPSTDWVAAYGAVRKRQVSSAKGAVAKAASLRNAESKPSLPLAKYAGRYRDPWYGDVVVEDKSGKLHMSFTHSPALTGAMEHFQYDTFVARWKDRSLDADAYVTFSLNANGSIERVKMKAVSPLTDFSFDFHDLALTPVSLDVPPYD